MKNGRKLICVFLAVLLTFSLLTTTAMAADPKSYLALGDSISTGYRLDDPDAASFPALLAAELGEDYVLTNLAKDGETTGTLLARLTEATNADYITYTNAVANADLITLTIGGNDLMALLYSFVAEELSTPDNPMTLEDVKTMIETGANLETMTQVAEVLNNNDFKPSVMQLLGIANNFTQLLRAIRTCNPDAQLVVTTQYDPYQYLAAQVHQYEALLSANPQYKTLADAILKLSSTINEALATFNAALKRGTEYLVADVYTDFYGEEPLKDDPLCNAKLVLMPTSIDMDFHPNGAGHQRIAACVAEVLAAADQEANVKLTITGEEEVAIWENTATFHITASNCVDTALLRLTIEADPAQIGNLRAEAPADSLLLESEYADGKLRVTVSILKGLNGTAEALTVTGDLVEDGEATITITKAEATQYLSDGTEAYVETDLSEAAWTVNIVDNPYDVNRDGVVNLLDVTRAQRYYGQSHALADVDKDGEVAIADLILILQNCTE